MEGFPLFCQFVVITANIIALVKSIELIFVGAALFVLDPALTLLHTKVIITSRDMRSDVSGAIVVRLVAVFLLITGPIIFVVGVAGLCGAYRKSNGWLASYLALLVVLNTTIVLLFAIGIPSSLMDPSTPWRPLTDFVLTSLVLALAAQGLMIFFTVVLMSSVSKDSMQINPAQRNSKLAGQ